jgi:hypothetical protein
MQQNPVDTFRESDNFKIEVEVNSDRLQEIVSADVLIPIIEETLIVEVEAIPRSVDLDISVEDRHIRAIINHSEIIAKKDVKFIMRASTKAKRKQMQ